MKRVDSLQLYREFIRLSYRFPVENVRQKIRLNTREMWQLMQHETNKVTINNSITKARNIYTLLQKLIQYNSFTSIFPTSNLNDINNIQSINKKINNTKNNKKQKDNNIENLQQQQNTTETNPTK